VHDVLLAAAILTGLTFAFGTVLALSARYLHVAEDPRLSAAEALLGGSNCGACGKPGCHAFALALVAGECAPAQCTVIGPDAVAEIAVLLGVEAGETEPLVARLHCAGGRSAVRQLAEYTGPPTCAAAFAAQRAGRSCAYGCVGLGDCERACTFDAIHMNSEGLPVVSVDACTACGDCVRACPADLFTLEPRSHKIVVQCSSPLVGDVARESCLVACDACGRCALDAPPGAIEMVGGLPRLQRPKAIGEHAVCRCPTGAIRWVESEQLSYDVPLSALRRSRV